MVKAAHFMSGRGLCLRAVIFFSRKNNRATLCREISHET